MQARFYAPGAAAGETVTLPREEGEHLTRVLRLKPGAVVRVFDGRGAEFDGVVEHAVRDEVQIVLGAPRAAARETSVAVTLVQGVLKGDKMDDVVRDAVMMGAAAIQPIVTARTEVTLAALERGHRRERWGRIAVSSAKQCGRAVVPAILAPVAFERYSTDHGPRGIRLMFVEPGSADGATSVRDLDPTPPRDAAVLVGPEGGWTPEEVAVASAFCQLMTLGVRTLRADTMAIVALSVLFTRWGEL